MTLLSEYYMPLYEYECGNCGLVFDKIQRIEDRYTASCPECDSGCARTKGSLTSNYTLGNELGKHFTKEGPGFQSKYMSHQEYKARVRERSLEEAIKEKGKVPVKYNSVTGDLTAEGYKLDFTKKQIGY